MFSIRERFTVFSKKKKKLKHFRHQKDFSTPIWRYQNHIAVSIRKSVHSNDSIDNGVSSLTGKKKKKKKKK